MDTIILETFARKKQVHKTPIQPKVELQLKSFEQAIEECNGRPASEFFDELKRQVKHIYNEKDNF